MIDVVGIGASLQDMVMTIGCYPKEDTKMEAAKVDYQCGGPAATGIVAAAKLGVSTAFLGLFTDDGNAKAMIEDFNKYGVDTSSLCIKRGYTSGVAVVINTIDKASRTIVWTKGSIPETAPEDIHADTIKQAKMLYLDGNHYKAALHACIIAKENNVKILIDAGALYKGMPELLSYADIIIASEEFAQGISQTNTVSESAGFLENTYKPDELIITCGDKGGYYMDNGEMKSYPCYPAPGRVINTNGAGDVFHGAFAYAYIKGYELKKCIHFASATSAIKCTKAKVREGIPSAEEVMDYLKSHQ